MNDKYTRHVVLGYRDAFQNRECTPLAMMTHIEETAADHCLAVGADVFSLQEKGLGWVLTSGSLKMSRYPRYKEEIFIDTWITGFKTFLGRREYAIRSASGEELGRSSSQWLFMDIVNKKPYPIPAVFRENWPKIAEKGISEPLVMGTGTEGQMLTRELYDVERMDIDSNYHVHNVKYLEWLLNSLPPRFFDTMTLSDISIKFLQEANLGDQVEAVTLQREDGFYEHSIRLAGSREPLARAVSEWKEKDSLALAV